MPVGQATMFSHYAYNAPSIYLLTYSYCSSHMLPFSLVHWCFVSTVFKNFPASLFTHSDQEKPCAWKFWTFYNFFPKVAPLLPCLNDTWGDEGLCHCTWHHIPHQKTGATRKWLSFLFSSLVPQALKATSGLVVSQSLGEQNPLWYDCRIRTFWCEERENQQSETCSVLWRERKNHEGWYRQKEKLREKCGSKTNDRLKLRQQKNEKPNF